MFLCGLITEYMPACLATSSGSVGRPGSHSTLHGSTPLQPCTTSLPSSWPFWKKPTPVKMTWPGICTFVPRTLGPHGTSEQPTLTPFLIACLIVGVSGPPSFGPTNHAWYLFDTSASRSWLTCLLVVNCASNVVNFTFGYFFAMSFAPSSSASQ